MRKRFSLLQPHPATAIALLSLFISLSGIAYAASLPKNSVGSKQIKKKAVTNAKIRTGAVDSRTIKDGSVGPDDLSSSAKTSGPVGPTGPAGSARAYAFVNKSGPTLAVSKGFTAVDRVGIGTYCLTVDPATGIDVDNIAPVASVEFQTTSFTATHVEPRAVGNTSMCGSGKMEVRTYKSTGAYDDDISFTLMIP